MNIILIHIPFIFKIGTLFAQFSFKYRYIIDIVIGESNYRWVIKLWWTFWI